MNNKSKNPTKATLMPFYQSSSVGIALINSLNTMITDGDITAEEARCVLVFQTIYDYLDDYYMLCNQAAFDRNFQITLRENIVVKDDVTTLSATQVLEIIPYIDFGHYYVLLYREVLQATIKSAPCGKLMLKMLHSIQVV